VDEGVYYLTISQMPVLRNQAFALVITGDKIINVTRV